MDTLQQLTQLIESLPDSDTKANLLAVRGALRAGPKEEARFRAYITGYARAAIQRLETEIQRSADSEP